ncbi:MAG: hypothetical protein WCO79_03080 [bacterium]
MDSKWETVLCEVRYFEFVSVIDGFRVKIILKQTDNVPVFFLSVIPFWKEQSKSDDEVMDFDGTK